MEDLIKFTDYAESIGFDLRKLSFQEVVDLHSRIKRNLIYAFDTLNQVEEDMKEMKSA